MSPVGSEERGWAREDAMQQSPLWGFPGGLAGGWHCPEVGKIPAHPQTPDPHIPPGTQGKGKCHLDPHPLHIEPGRSAPEEGVMNCLLERCWHEEAVETRRRTPSDLEGKVEPPFTREDGAEMTGKSKLRAAGGWKTGVSALSPE